jgi:zinc/manganese transport system substrate-binding protein
VPTLEVAPLVGPIDGPSGTPDPHVWTDPLRIARGAQHVTAVIARRVHPSRRAAVVARGDAYVRALRADHRWIARRLKGLPPARRVLVTNHHVLGYFAERYRFRVIGTIIPGQSTLASPSAADLAELAATIRRQRVRAIFIDSSSPRRLADALAELAGLRVQVITLYSESLGPPGSSGATYRRMIRTNADRIAKGLGAPKPPS